MPEVFEVYGYPVDDRSDEANQWRLSAKCPFIGSDCDGGGNRYSTHLRFASRPNLAHVYPNRTEIPAGVCSIMCAEESPWIVCPRRLLVLGRPGSTRCHQQHIEDAVLGMTGYPPGARVGVWTEAKFKAKVDGKVFDYTFDYVFMQVGTPSLPVAAASAGMSTTNLLTTLRRSGYAITTGDGGARVVDFPIGVPTILEIMTSSTSGSNKDKGTTIQDAFENAVLGKPHVSPGINKRQVWARMVSQLIVKSEVGLRWGGKTLWLLQDNLVDYICSSTGLDVHGFETDQTSEVNVVTVSYGDKVGQLNGIIELPQITLYAGPVGSQPLSKPAFIDIVRTPPVPPLSALFALIAKKGPAAEYLTV